MAAGRSELDVLKQRIQSFMSEIIDLAKQRELYESEDAWKKALSSLYEIYRIQRDPGNIHITPVHVVNPKSPTEAEAKQLELAKEQDSQQTLVNKEAANKKRVALRYILQITKLTDEVEDMLRFFNPLNEAVQVYKDSMAFVQALVSKLTTSLEASIGFGDSQPEIKQESGSADVVTPFLVSLMPTEQLEEFANAIESLVPEQGTDFSGPLTALASAAKSKSKELTHENKESGWESKDPREVIRTLKQELYGEYKKTETEKVKVKEGINDLRSAAAGAARKAAQEQKLSPTQTQDAVRKATEKLDKEIRAREDLIAIGVQIEKKKMKALIDDERAHYIKADVSLAHSKVIALIDSKIKSDNEFREINNLWVEFRSNEIAAAASYTLSKKAALSSFPKEIDRESKAVEGAGEARPSQKVRLEPSVLNELPKVVFAVEQAADCVGSELKLLQLLDFTASQCRLEVAEVMVAALDSIKHKLPSENFQGPNGCFRVGPDLPRRIMKHLSEVTQQLRAEKKELRNSTAEKYPLFQLYNSNELFRNACHQFSTLTNIQADTLRNSKVDIKHRADRFLEELKNRKHQDILNKNVNGILTRFVNAVLNLFSKYRGSTPGSKLTTMTSSILKIWKRDNEAAAAAAARNSFGSPRRNSVAGAGVASRASHGAGAGPGNGVLPNGAGKRQIPGKR